MRRIVLISLALILFSCESAEDNLEILGTQADIIGTWVDAGYDGQLNIMERADAFNPEKYGFILKEDGTFREHKNAGWCATEPITYDNYNGNWVALSDSILEITVGFWGGMMTYYMHIVSLEEDTLKIIYEYEVGE